MRSQQQQQQFDLYYQGTQQQLLALLYPLGGPHAHTFQHLQQQKVTYHPSTKQLNYTYQLQNFQNIDRKKQPITYQSKLVQNKSNYFYSVFDQVTGSFIWRSVSGFVELRPKMTKESANSKSQVTAGTAVAKKQQTALNQQQAPVQLTVIESGSPQNTSERQLYNVPLSQTKPCWQCSKQQYFAYLSN